MDKKELRRAIRERKRAMSEEEIVTRSAALGKSFAASELYQNAETIYGYLPYNQEVRTVPMLEQALLDGCLVLQWDEGATTPRVRGIDYWENFLKVSRNKEKISLRVVYFTSSHYWFSDLYYSHEVYSLYTRDTYSENQIGPYKYMTQIVGKDIYSKKPVNCFVFTDDPELGAEEVLSLTHICDIEAERNVTFTIVDFTTYLN